MPTSIFQQARGQRVPVVVWARDANEETLRQLVRVASRPFVVMRVCAMADAHVASDVAVGTVFATEGAVVPRALGTDIGCGVAAWRLSLSSDEMDRERLDRVVAMLVRAIPAGQQIHRGRGARAPDALFEGSLSTRALEHAREALVRRHLGTLGGGNHFLELDRDAHGSVWLLVHSGSRGLGSAVAAHHGRIAELADPDPLAGLSGEAARAYVDDHTWALTFARANRDAIATRAIEVVAEIARCEVVVQERIDVHHNYVARETWEERDVLVHRKGAVHVPCGVRALVPGSMATASYVVEGIGCARAFDSCSHGAGRVMTRTEARDRVHPDALRRAMKRIAWPAHLARSLVEEAPTVYRDIGAVLEDQRDLVARVMRLTPLAVLKG
jgi:tRNA-splicing ligase RtcB